MHKILTTDTILVIDVETTGLIAGVHSILSLGAVAYRNGEEFDSFYGAMHEWEGSERDPDTMKDFWMDQHLDEWKRIRSESRPPEEVMQEFYKWAKGLKSPRTLSANPAGFDSSMLWWYLHTFCGPKAVGELFKRHRALDIRSYIAAILAVPYSQAERSLCPAEWSEGFVITHNALDDAREQGVMLMNLLKASIGELEFPEVPEFAEAASGLGLPATTA